MEKNSRRDRCGQRPRRGLAQKDGAWGKVCRPVLACESQRLPLRRKAAAASTSVRSVHCVLCIASPTLVLRGRHSFIHPQQVLFRVPICERMVWNRISVVRAWKWKSCWACQEPPVLNTKRLPQISVVCSLEARLAD